MSCFGQIDNASAQTNSLILTFEQSAPLNMSEDGGRTVRGLVADKVLEMMRRAHVKYETQLWAWNRAFEIALITNNACVFSTVRNDEREQKFKWIGPLADGEWTLFGRPDKVGTIERLEQAKGATIGGYLGDAAGRYLIDNGYKVVLSYDDDISLKNLLIGRLDYWASGRRGGMARIARLKVADRVIPLLSFHTVHFYLACNPGVEDKTIQRLRKALDAMSADGTVAKIDAKYPELLTR